MFKVRSAYPLARQWDEGTNHGGSSSNPDGERKMWKKIWSALIPSKVRVFAWKVVNNGLPTRANKFHRHLEDGRSCKLCGDNVEDAFHAMIGCQHARALRCAIRDHCVLLEEEVLVNSGPDWFLLLVDRCDEQSVSNFLLLIWQCWSFRNCVLKEGKAISIDGSVGFLTRYMTSCYKSDNMGNLRILMGIKRLAILDQCPDV